MTKVWQLHHVRDTAGGCEDIKQIGLFATEAEAHSIMQEIRVEPGFREFPDGFVISEVLLGHVAFDQGFVITESKDDNRPGMDSSGRTAFWYAVHDSATSEIDRLAVQTPEDVDLADDAGETPLRVAVARKNSDLVGKLISLGADVNATDKHGDGPLWEAVRQACFSQASLPTIEIVRALISAGANRDQIDSFGQTPRSVAQKDPVVAAILEECGV
jgi:hypothetical protein